MQFGNRDGGGRKWGDKRVSSSKTGRFERLRDDKRDRIEAKSGPIASDRGDRRRER